MWTSVDDFVWTPTKKRAAVLVAEDKLSIREIASELGVNKQTITRWKHHPAFIGTVADHAAELHAEMMRKAIAKKRERIKVLDTLHDKLLTVIDERAERYVRMEHETADDETDRQSIARVAQQVSGGTAETTVPPGGATGLVVRQLKQIGTGFNAKTVEEFAVDTGTIKAIQSLQEQAAKEMGQWVERGELAHTGEVWHTHTHDLSRLTDDELRQLRALRLKIDAEDG